MTGFNIDRFRASLSYRDGVLKTNKFEVTMTLPPIFDGDENLGHYMSIIQDGGLWCDAASIPGLVEQNMKFRRYGVGPLDTVPLSVNFEDIQLRFIVDGNGDIWRLFHEWRNKIINTNSLKGMWAPGTEQSSGEELYPYETAWQCDYQTSLFIQWYAENGDEVKLIHVNQAYPTAVSAVQLDWGDNGDVARFMVNFTLQDWQYRDALSNPMVSS